MISKCILYLSTSFLIQCYNYAYAQTKYLEALKNATYEIDSNQLMKNLQGYWSFSQLVTKERKRIDSIFHDLSKDMGIPNYGFYEKVDMPNFCFSSNKYMEYFDGEKFSEGRFEYDVTNKTLYLLFESPKDISGYGMSKGNELYIKYLDDKSLQLIELLPSSISTDSLEYNISIYKKTGECHIE